MKLSFEVARMLILLIFFTSSNYSRGHKMPSSSSSLSCGNITDIRKTFSWKMSDLHPSPSTCSSLFPYVELDCHKNHTVMWIGSSGSKDLYVVEMNYKEQFIRVVDPGISRDKNLSSCPLQYSIGRQDFPFGFHRLYLNPNLNIPIAFVHCLTPMNSTRYIKAPFCGNGRNKFANSSILYSYVMTGTNKLSDLEESCTVDRISWASSVSDNSSLVSIYDGLAHGFKVAWRDFPYVFQNTRTSFFGVEVPQSYSYYVSRTANGSSITCELSHNFIFTLLCLYSLLLIVGL